MAPKQKPTKKLPPHKRTHKKDKNLVDRISKLPEEIIVNHILSRLPSIYAIRTSALSKQWQFYWSKLNHLCFTFYGHKKDNTSNDDRPHHHYRDGDEEDDEEEDFDEDDEEDFDEETESNDDNDNNNSNNKKDDDDDDDGKSDDGKKEERTLEKSTYEFVEFVTGVLFIHSAPKLEFFAVGFRYSEEYEYLVSRWIRYVTLKKVETLNLLFTPKNSVQIVMLPNPFREAGVPDLYILPQHLFTNDSVKSMYLSLCYFWPQSKVNWGSLEKLVITDTVILDDVLKKLLVGSPQLKHLQLCDIRGLCYVDTKSCPSLKVLVIDGFDHGGPHLMQIAVSSNLEVLCLKGDLYETRVELVKGVSSSLKEAILAFRVGVPLPYDDEEYLDDYYKDYHDMLLDLLDKVSGAQKLSIGMWCIKVLSMSQMKDVLLPFFSCKALVLKTLLTNSELPGVIRLLESSPHLEELLITSGPISNLKPQLVQYLTSYRSSDSTEHELMHAPDNRLETSIKELKKIEIRDCKTCRYKDKSIDEFSSLMFKHQRSLEKIKICTEKE